jgi:hypothetical protein
LENDVFINGSQGAGFLGLEVGGTDSGLCPVVDFRIQSFEAQAFATTMLVML